MKKQISKIQESTRSLFSKIIPVIFLILGMIPTRALAADSTSHTPSASSFTYLGTYNRSELLFQVNFENAANTPFTIMIKDQDGFVLYEQKFKQGSLTKKYLIQMDDISAANLTFTIVAGKEKASQTFEVDTRLSN